LPCRERKALGKKGGKGRGGPFKREAIGKVPSLNDEKEGGEIYKEAVEGAAQPEWERVKNWPGGGKCKQGKETKRKGERPGLLSESVVMGEAGEKRKRELTPSPKKQPKWSGERDTMFLHWGCQQDLEGEES